MIWERDLKKWCSHLWFERGETGISYKSFSQISLSNHSLQGVSREWFEREIWKNELVIFPNLSLKSLSPIPHSSHSLEFLHLISLSLIIVSLVTPSIHFLKSLSQINVSSHSLKALSRVTLSRVITSQIIVSTHCNSTITLSSYFLKSLSARPYESYKIFKGRPRRNAFSKLVHRQYKSFPPDRFCQVEIQKSTGLSNKPSTA